MPSTVLLKALGLNTSPNQLDVPEGSLSEASNIIIDRDNIIEPRRGYKLYGTAMPDLNDRAKQLLEYKGRILRHYSNILQFDDGEGNFSNFSGNYSETQTGLRIKSVESNGNFYFTTSDGIKKISAKTADQLSSSSSYISQAGGIKAIDFEAELNYTLGFQTGFLPLDAAVAYRIVWGINDANSNLILGASSQRVELYNFILPILLRDYMALLGALDDINQVGSEIRDGNYVSTLKLTVGASAQELRNNLVALVEKLDEDLLLADNVPVAPLTISGATITSGACTVSFSSGDPTLYFDVGSKIFLTGFSPTTGTLNGAQVITSLTSTDITFTTTATGVVTLGAPAEINSNEYRSIFQPSLPATLATHDELVSLQTYLNAILARLQSEPNAIIDNTLQTTYIDSLDTTTTSNATLNITIPEGVTSNHFFQIYRSEIAQATGGLILSSDVTPSDELQLIYEAFPTEAELTAGVIEVDDITPDTFRGTNLYTNPASGEGILQANDIPPFAKDINIFKDVVFYANTKTKHRYNTTLLGVSRMLEDYDGGDIPKLAIASTDQTDTYHFIRGEFEETDITTVGGGSLAASGAGSYFTLNSANNQNEYYIWYQIGTSTDPMVAGRTGIQVTALAGDTAAQIATKTGDVLSRYNDEFQIDVVSDTITVLNLDEGYTDDATVGTSGFTILVTNQGQGERFTREIYDITTVADVAGSLAGTYFTLNTPQNQYYVWYKVSNVGVDPAIANKIGILVDIDTNDTAAVVAEKTADKLNELPTQFIAEDTGSNLNIKVVSFGSATNPTAGTSGFTISVTQEGALEVLLSSAASPSQAVDITSRSLTKGINLNSGSTIYSYYISGPLDAPGQMLFEAKSLGADSIYILGNNSNTGQSFSPSIEPTLTITSISTGTPDTMLVTTSTNHGLANLDEIVISGSNSIPSIDGVYPITYVSPTTFRINAYVATAGTEGSAISASLAEESTNEEKGNRIYYAKANQPEAVPIVNFFDVGGSEKEILRIFPLRDSLFVFKEDGLYRVSGEISPFNLALFDGSYTLIAPDSLALSNNVLFAWSDQGLSTVSESGASNISRAIDDQILKIQIFDNFSTATWGIGYESDNSYLVFTTKKMADTVATICYRYSSLSNTWTTFDKTNTCGVILITDDKMYLGAGDTNYIEQERKEFERYDYADREVDLLLASANYLGDQIKLSNVSEFKVGDVLVQTQKLTVYEFNMLLKKLDLDPTVADSDYFDTLEAVGGDNLRNKIVALATKLDADTGITATDFASTIASKSGSITALSVANPTIITSAAHGLVNGRKITITGTDSTPSVNGDYIISLISASTFSIDEEVTAPGTTGSFTTDVEDYDDILACYNAIITKLNTDTGVSFSNYNLSNNETIMEAIIIDITKSTNTLTLNIELDYIVGPFKIYKAFESKFTYAPNIMGDPLGIKHLREATMMFANKAFTNATMSFATDLLPQFIPVEFNGDGNGIFGHITGFGDNFFGGGSHSAPFRTYIPRNCQRCRYIIVRFSHRVARESYQIYGTSLTGEVGLSTRGYR